MRSDKKQSIDDVRKEALDADDTGLARNEADIVEAEIIEELKPENWNDERERIERSDSRSDSGGR